MGASRVIIPGNFPIGCIPGYLTSMASSEPSAYDSMGCLKELNLFAAKHNTKLQRAIADLRTSYPDASIAYADYFNSFFSLLKGASGLGTRLRASTQFSHTKWLCLLYAPVG
jgi:hypothetical protein